MPLKILKDHPLREYSTFRIGGKARYFTTVHNVEEAKEAFVFACEKSLPHLVIGRGSNLLLPDRGYRGLVIYNRIHHVVQEGVEMIAGSGVGFPQFGLRAARLGLSGLEFAAGIPGSVGGAIYMNAGAGGQETFDTLKQVTFLNREGEVEHFFAEQLRSGYRTSMFQEMDGMILEGRFQLEKSSTAGSAQQELLKYRMETQPYDEKSIGCIFQNPQGDSAGRIIEKLGLKGYGIGGAIVSSVHANFIVNAGDATESDVKALISYIQEKAEEELGIELKTEVKLAANEDDPSHGE